MRIETLRQRLADLGAKPVHVQRMLRAWLHALPLDAGPARRGPALPRAIVEALPALGAELAGLARVRSEHPAEDGSARLLVELADGQTVESVLLPRDGLCVSSQVGCAVGCTFCMTGRDGLLRQVDSGEMVAQVVLARQRRTVSRVVFMGMGEPSHNMDNVLEAIDTLGTYGGIGHKNLVFSTVGDYRVFERLPQQRVRPALAISLHTTRPELRAELLPQATPADLLELARWPQGRGAVLMVGHQPVLGQTAAQLLDMPGADCAIRKGAVWWLRQRQRQGESQTVLLAAMSPDLL